MSDPRRRSANMEPDAAARDQGEVRQVLQPAPARASDGRRVEPSCTWLATIVCSWLRLFLLRTVRVGAISLLCLCSPT